MKQIILILVVVVVFSSIYYLIAVKKNAEPADLAEDTVSGMRAEETALIVTEQRPGNSITVAQVYLAEPGYVVIHEDNNGEAGAIIGSSALLQAGENNKIIVTLNRETRDGEKLWSMLHSEENNNSSFEASVDTPVQSRIGGPIMGWFEISATAEENIGVTL